MKIEFIGEKEGYLALISNGKQSFYAGGAVTPVYPLNSATSHDLCNDKFYSYEILKRNNIKIPKTQVFFPNFSSQNQYNIPVNGIPAALEYVKEELSYPVIIKPNRGSMGRGVKLVYNDTDLSISMNESLKYGHACLVQQKISGEEYRLFCLKGKAKFIYKKLRPALIGDGKSSVLELLKNNQQIDLSKIDLESVREIVGHHDLKLLPAKTDQEVWDRILKHNEKIEISNIGNITTGSKITELTQNVNEKISELGKSVSDALQLEICGIDVFITQSGEPVILEVNANPSLLGISRLGEKQLCMDIWGEIFETYFD